MRQINISYNFNICVLSVRHEILPLYDICICSIELSYIWHVSIHKAIAKVIHWYIELHQLTPRHGTFHRGLQEPGAAVRVTRAPLSGSTRKYSRLVMYAWTALGAADGALTGLMAGRQIPR